MDNNIVGNAGTGKLDINTILDTTPADNGGPTLTQALVTDSPAIDAGNNSRTTVDGNAGTTPLANDQRGPGFPRISNGTVDIGAFEFNKIKEQVTAAINAGNLEIAGTTDADSISITTDGTSVFVNDGVNQQTFAVADITGKTIVINGGDGNDTLMVDLGLNATGITIEYNGQGQTGSPGDQLLLTGSADSLEYVFNDAHSGSVQVNGSGTDFITYTGLEPINGPISPSADITLIYSNGENDNIVLTDAGSGQITVTATDTGETVTFAAPSNSLTIRGGGGDDSITVSSLPAGFAAQLTLDGEGGTDNILIDANLNLGAKDFSLAAETITVNAGVKANAAILTHTGTLDINAAGDFELEGSFFEQGGGAVELSGDITTTAGDITFADAVTLTADVALSTRMGGGNVRFGSTLNEDGGGSTRNLSITVDRGDVTFAGAIGDVTDPQSITVNSANLVSFADVVGVYDALHIKAVEIDFGGGANSVSTSHSGTLVLSPVDPAQDIVVGGTADSGTALDITDADLAVLADGFSEITIGDEAAGTGAVTVLSSLFRDFITIAGGSISVTELDAGTNDVSLVARRGSITEGGDSGTDITGGRLKLDSQTGVGASGDELSTGVGTLAARVQSGPGGIFVSNTGSLTLGAADGLSGATTQGGDMVFSSGASLNLTDAVDSNGGNVQLSAATGVTVPTLETNGGTYTVNADSDDDASGTYAQTGTVAAGTGAVSITAGDVNLSGPLSGSSTLMLTPSSPDRSLGIGTGAGGDFNLDATDLTNLQDGFRSITIGDPVTGTGAVDVNASVFHDPLTIVGGSIDVDRLDAGANDVTLTARDDGVINSPPAASASQEITGGTVTLNGQVSPGGSRGRLDIKGDLDLNASDTYVVELNGTDPGTGYDQLQVTGDISLAGAMLDPSRALPFVPSVGTVFTIVSATGTISGTFAGLADGDPIAIGDINFRINYTPSAVTLTVLAPTTVYVDDDFPNPTTGEDPDESPNDPGTPNVPGTPAVFGYDAFQTIQEGVAQVRAGGTVFVARGVYDESVMIGKDLTLDGSGALTLIDAGNSNGVTLVEGADDVTVQDLRITHAFTGILDANTQVMSSLTLSNLLIDGSTQGGILDGIATLNVSLTANSDAANIDSTQFHSTDLEFIAYADVGEFFLGGAGGSDTFYVEPISSTTLTIDGGNPVVPATPGDTMNYDGSADVNVSGTGSGTLVPHNPGEQNVTFDSIEQVNTDNPPVLSIAGASVTEGTNPGTPQLVPITVTLSRGVVRPVTVTVSTADGSAHAGSDYTPLNQFLTFAPGELSKMASALVNQDDVVEQNESFLVDLNNATGAAIVNGSAQVNILDDDGPATVSIGSVGRTEGDAGATNFVFTVSLDKAVDAPVSVLAQTALDVGGTSPASVPDFISNSQILTFQAGERTKTFTVQVNGDRTVESDETFLVDLSDLQAAGRNVRFTGGAIAIHATGLITNDDAATLSINDVAEAEGNSGTTDFVFTVSLSQPIEEIVTVNVQTQAETASAGEFSTSTKQLTFDPTLADPNEDGDNNPLTQQVIVHVTGDTTIEPDETFRVRLEGATFASVNNSPQIVIGKIEGLGTILNDDTATLRIRQDASGTESAGSVDFVVELLNVDPQIPLEGTDTITVTANPIPSLPPSAGPLDLSFAPQVLTFSANDLNDDGDENPLTQTVHVPVFADGILENNETFQLQITNASFDGLLDPSRVFISATESTRTGTVHDTDQATLFISDAPDQSEGGTAAFRVNLVGDISQDVTVLATTRDGSANAGSDYVPLTGFPVTFSPGGPKFVDVPVQTINDGVSELAENFFVDLSLPTFGGSSNPRLTIQNNPPGMDGEAMGTILDNTPSPATLSFHDVTVSGGEESGMLEFTVDLSRAFQDKVTVQVDTAQTSTGAGIDAQSGVDFTPLTGMLLTFNAGETSKSVAVSLVDDPVVEPNETFTVSLSIRKLTA